MNIWEILGIPPTTDIIVIKKAYADRAKEWHPEEHPEEFKRLRSAYQTAVKRARSDGAGENGAGVESQPTEEKEASEDPRPAEEKEANEKTRTAEEKEAGRNPRPEEAEREEEPQPRFSYDDVSSFYQEELAERFFEEFDLIAWNPYLQNRKAVWIYFLFRPDYDDLYCHEDFRQRLLQKICGVPGWLGETLDYFEDWQDLFWEPIWKWQREDGRMRIERRKWRRKKRRSRFTWLMPEYVVSQEQRQEHYAILQIMQERGLDGSLSDAFSAEAYLRYYRAFVKDNIKWQESQRRFSCRKRLKYWITFGFLLGSLTIILILVLVVRPLRNAAEKEKMQEYLQEEQESLEQEEWQRELDERFKDMQEQYRDWMEQ